MDAFPAFFPLAGRAVAIAGELVQVRRSAAVPAARSCAAR